MGGGGGGGSGPGGGSGSGSVGRLSQDRREKDREALAKLSGTTVDKFFQVSCESCDLRGPKDSASRLYEL